MTATVTRRGFLGSAAAGLTIVLSPTISSMSKANDLRKDVALNIWVTISPDNMITLVCPAAELGQGTHTSVPAIFADEMDADWAKVRLIDPPGWIDKMHGNPGWNQNFNTTASLSIMGYYMPMRIAGAQARRVLMDAAAAMWNVPVVELSTEPSVVVHASSGRRVSYGDIAVFAEPPKELPKIEEKDLKDPSQFRYIGKDLARRDVLLKVRGAAKYGIDVEVPGMVIAALLQSPSSGGNPDTVDDADALAVPGVTQVVRIPGGVAVIGDSYTSTQAAKNLLKVTWTSSLGANLDSEHELEQFAAIVKDPKRKGLTFLKPTGDVDKALAAAASVFRSEVYRTRLVVHAQMEPLNATAIVSQDGKSAEIWAGTQSPSILLNDVANALKTERSKITFHQHLVGGGFGRRGGGQEGAIQVVQIAKAVGKPVKLMWSREDEFGAGRFRPMTAQYIEAGFDATGKLIAWHHRIAAESVYSYRASLAGTKVEPRADSIVMGGSPMPHYQVPNKRAEHVLEIRGARLSSFRGIGPGANSFVVESVMDEIAKTRNRDPLDFRLELTQGLERHQAILRKVAEMAEWHRPRTGRGLGLHLMQKDETIGAGIAEVSVDAATGNYKVHNFWACVDAGRTVQPKHVAALIEGGIVFGLGQALGEKITIKDGRVQQINFSDYRVTRMSDMPEIHVEIISSNEPPYGVGEDGAPLAAGAVGNAIAAACGVRLRELPFEPRQIAAALKTL